MRKITNIFYFMINCLILLFLLGCNETITELPFGFKLGVIPRNKIESLLSEKKIYQVDNKRVYRYYINDSLSGNINMLFTPTDSPLSSLHIIYMNSRIQNEVKVPEYLKKDDSGYYGLRIEDVAYLIETYIKKYGPPASIEKNTALGFDESYYWVNNNFTISLDVRQLKEVNTETNKYVNSGFHHIQVFFNEPRKSDEKKIKPEL